MSPLAQKAKHAFEAYHNRHPDPSEDIWTEVAEAVVRGVLEPEAGLRQESLMRWALLVSAAIFTSVGEKEIGAALAGGSLHLAKDEPFFVLRGQDLLAPGAIDAWIRSAEIANVPEWKLEQAREVRDRMLRWNGERKHPD